MLDQNPQKKLAAMPGWRDHNKLVCAVHLEKKLEF